MVCNFLSFWNVSNLRNVFKSDKRFYNNIIYNICILKLFTDIDDSRDGSLNNGSSGNSSASATAAAQSNDDVGCIINDDEILYNNHQWFGIKLCDL